MDVGHVCGCGKERVAEGERITEGLSSCAGKAPWLQRVPGGEVSLRVLIRRAEYFQMRVGNQCERLRQTTLNLKDASDRAG